MNTGGITQLDTAISNLLDEDEAGGPGMEYGPEIIELERQRARLDAAIAQRLVRFDQSAEWSIDGSRSAASWISKRTCGNKPEIAHRVHVARMVNNYDLTRLAWQCGRISTQHVNVIAKTQSRARADEHFREFEGELVKLAMRAWPKDVARRAREWRDALDDLLDRDGANKPHPNDHKTSEAHYSRTIYGIGILDARFDTENAELIATAIQRAYDKGHRVKDPRTPSLQRADAIIEIFRAYLAVLPTSGNRPHVSIIASHNPRCSLGASSLHRSRLAHARGAARARPHPVDFRSIQSFDQFAPTHSGTRSSLDERRE